MIDEWTVGDHISLSRNPNYFRNSEGLPYFDQLVFRFVDGAEQALAALLAGECDYLDESTQIQSQSAVLSAAQASDELRLLEQTGPAWEHLDFGIVSRNTTLPPYFQSKEVRQAVALCIDRQKIVAELAPSQAVVMESYVPPEHPLFNADVKHYMFDPKTAGSNLDSLGWLDEDGNSSTPRLAWWSGRNCRRHAI